MKPGSGWLRTPAARRTLLGTALAMTVAAAIYPVAEEEEGSLASASRSPVLFDTPAVEAGGVTGETAGTTQQASRIYSERLGQVRELPGAKVDLFDTARWSPEVVAEAEKVESQKRAAAVPAPPPKAPPLPFTFFGRLLDGDRRQVFLNHRNQTLILGSGDTFDRVYRLDRIEDDRLHFTYLPLGQEQVLAIPGASGSSGPSTGKAVPGNTGIQK